MSVQIINPKNGLPLNKIVDKLIDDNGNFYPIINFVPRITFSENYSSNFGFQWNSFINTQLDGPSLKLSLNRFQASTNWNLDNLNSLDILEVGSGAGRFSRILLVYSKCNLWSIDYSNAVDANFNNNNNYSDNRFKLFQASIYDLPFPDDSFDKVFCLGVLQHTPDFEKSIQMLIQKAKKGSEIVVDFYPIKGWWTKIHTKYLLRPITKRLSHSLLLRIIKFNITWLITLFDILMFFKLGFLTRFLPITDLRGFPSELGKKERKEWAILDTFDGFSPKYDNPQSIKAVLHMFEKNGARVTFAGFVNYNEGTSAVVRAIKSL